jgi:hypothetical protein
VAFTVKNVIDEVRPLIADTEQPYRWSDARVKAKINSSIGETFSRRPDSLLTASSSAPNTLSSMYDEVPMEDRFKIPLVFYAAYLLLMERASDKSLRTQGMDFLKLYANLMEQ